MEKEPVQFPVSSAIEELMSKVGKGKDTRKNGVSFQQMLSNLVNKVDQLEKNADYSVQKLITGDEENIHQVMIAAEEANLAFQLMMEIRNKLIEAYKEIMRMQI